MELVAPILFIFAAATFLGCLPTFTALWARILHGLAVLRSELVVQAAQRRFSRANFRRAQP